MSIAFELSKLMWVLSAGCKALLSVLLSTPSGLAYLVQQQEGSQSLISALQNRHATVQLDHVALLLQCCTPCASTTMHFVHALVHLIIAQMQVCYMVQQSTHLVASYVSL